MTRRTDRLNSLLREVISEVIHDNVKNPHIDGIITITRVEITEDLHYAKVFVSIIAKTPEQQQQTLAALKSAASFIGVQSSKKVVLRYFPELRFIFDDSAEKHMRIEKILKEISDERKPESEDEDEDSEVEDEDEDSEDKDVT